MAHKCSSPGCAFYLPKSYPLGKCPWHAAPGSGPVKITAAIAIAAAGLGGGIAYKKFREYLREKKLRRQRSAASSQPIKKASPKPRKRKSKPSARKKRGAAKPRLPAASGD
jgi:hypothetical protein